MSSSPFLSSSGASNDLSSYLWGDDFMLYTYLALSLCPITHSLIGSGEAYALVEEENGEVPDPVGDARSSQGVSNGVCSKKFHLFFFS